MYNILTANICTVHYGYLFCVHRYVFICIIYDDCCEVFISSNFLNKLQALMLLSNLSDGACETKDVIAENEAVLQKLAELLVCVITTYVAN